MSLSKQLLTKKNRPPLVTDLVDVVRQEVADKKGVSGATLKAGYATATKMMPDLVRKAVRKLLPDALSALEPFWEKFVADGGPDFGAYLAQHGEQVTAALLAITDARAEATSKEALKKVYRALRAKADAHVQAALPRLGATVQKHATRTP
ncbi:hypothetical protein F0U44_20015 [Nocardioides humilatus]|uniref:Uncharacterized protein n=1 Tax=Nocardioides humilatus TaxID=2607660 RepID=A0A5B1L5F4_9ACTN|nr:hypothetical protein [Nocardioides humilatus]KAA1415921.1 hypothetical protein F0U44_20015 [Nocardioides humilatus]